jgi:hypothetical protein
MKTRLRNPYRLRRVLIVSSILAIALFAQQAIAIPSLILPEDPVYMRAWRVGDSYWRTYLYDFPPGDYDVTEGYYLGWCVDQGHYVTPGEMYYPVYLYSSYDPEIPSYFEDPDWDKVNYIINHKQGTWEDIQNAIWHFISGPGGGSYSGWDPDVWAMINAANANGEGYEPDSGDVVAVLCDAGEGVQHTFIEVNTAVPEASTLMLLGSGLPGVLLYAGRKRLLNRQS